MTAESEPVSLPTRSKVRRYLFLLIVLGRLLEPWDALVLKGGWRGPAAGAALNTGFDMLALAFLFLSSGHGVSLLGKLTVILGGIGVVETTMVGLYSVLGVPTAIAVVVVLVYRLFSFWLPTLAGIALVPLNTGSSPHLLTKEKASGRH